MHPSDEESRLISGEGPINMRTALKEKPSADAARLQQPSPLQERIERVHTRSGLEETQIRAIIATQASRAQRLAAADDVIDNSGTVERLLVQVDALHVRYSALATQRA